VTQFARDAILRAAESIADAEALLITAGAGMGVDSGLPDFRGDEGFWRAYPPLRRLGISFVEMANPGWFDRDPELAWGFYGHRLGLYRDTTPHRGFQILQRWIETSGGCGFVFTSNVDGQFQKAGFDGGRIYECHGSIHHLQCASLCCHDIWRAESVEVTVDPRTFRARHPLPECPRCGGLARPNVLMFGDWNWIPHRSHAQETHFGRWLDGLGDSNLVVIEIGAGSAVPTVRFGSERAASRSTATLVRINPRESMTPRRQIGIAGNALETLSAVDRELGA